ncbi:hypothetical protein Q1695_000973 [Nippostrongylus brasiliensis]|nr:hypothetical protein Q1695_000973 [Nippostrongylus brasiliensis]
MAVATPLAGWSTATFRHSSLHPSLVCLNVIGHRCRFDFTKPRTTIRHSVLHPPGLETPAVPAGESGTTPSTPISPGSGCTQNCIKDKFQPEASIRSIRVAAVIIRHA